MVLVASYERHSRDKALYVATPDLQAPGLAACNTFKVPDRPTALAVSFILFLRLACYLSTVTINVVVEFVDKPLQLLEHKPFFSVALAAACLLLSTTTEKQWSVCEDKKVQHSTACFLLMNLCVRFKLFKRLGRFPPLLIL